jgi:hypothetical protein
MSLRALFDEHAGFYRERYVPFLQEEGFIDNPADSEFGEGVDGAAPIDAATVEGGAWPAGLRQLLFEVGPCVVNYPTARGPVPLFVMSPHDIAGWREAGGKSVVSYLKKADPSAPAASEAWPFLTDDAGGFVAFISANDGLVHIVSYEGKLRGPIDSLEAFFTLIFENAREQRMPFDGIPGDDAVAPPDEG